LEQQFTTNVPDEVWISDITYIWTGEGKRTPAQAGNSSQAKARSLEKRKSLFKLRQSGLPEKPVK